MKQENEQYSDNDKSANAFIVGGLLLATLAAGYVGFGVVYTQGRMDECSDLRQHGVVIPDQPADPSIRRKVIGYNECGEPEYDHSQDPYNPYGPFGPSGF